MRDLKGNAVCASEGGSPVHARHQIGGDRLASLVMTRERSKDLGAVHPLLEHLRRGFYKVPFHANTADPCPLLLSAEDVVHQVAELVEEGHHIVGRDQSPSAQGS